MNHFQCIQRYTELPTIKTIVVQYHNYVTKMIFKMILYVHMCSTSRCRRPVTVIVNALLLLSNPDMCSIDLLPEEENVQL